MKKSAQYSSMNYQPQLVGRTLRDLYISVRADAGLTTANKAQLIGQIKGMTGHANESMPLSALMLRGLGGSIGWLISKYFNMGPVSQVLASAGGFGIGSMIDNQLNKPKSPYPGYKLL